MTSTASRTFPLPPRDLVETMLAGDYQRLRGERLGGTAVPEVTRDGGVTVVRFPRRLPLDDLPGPLRSLAGSGNVTQVERWEVIGDDRCFATWTTESSLPGKATGTYEVLPDGDGCRYIVVATVRVNVPIVGGRISKEAEGHVMALVASEMDLAAEYLARR